LTLIYQLFSRRDSETYLKIEKVIGYTIDFRNNLYSKVRLNALRDLPSQEGNDELLKRLKNIIDKSRDVFNLSLHIDLIDDAIKALESDIIESK
jgi:hypothetical protein